MLHSNTQPMDLFRICVSNKKLDNGCNTIHSEVLIRTCASTGSAGYFRNTAYVLYARYARYSQAAIHVQESGHQ
jgi:hypothetical protein